MEEDKPTELTSQDFDDFFKKLINGDFDLKPVPCIKCGSSHFPSYGSCMGECDQCFFDRFPKDQVAEFCRSFFEQ